MRKVLGYKQGQNPFFLQIYHIHSIKASWYSLPLLVESFNTCLLDVDLITFTPNIGYQDKHFLSFVFVSGSDMKKAFGSRLSSHLLQIITD